MTSDLQPGTKIRIDLGYGQVENAKVLRPRKVALPAPGPDWCLVRFDRDGATLWVHRSGVEVAR